MKDKAPLPQGAEKEAAVRKMFDSIAPRYDLVNRIMTFGLDTRWRRRAVSSLQISPSDVVADVACGTGDLCREVSRSGALAIGFDVSLGMLQKAKTDAPLVQGDGLALPLDDGSVDGITCGFALRNVVDIEALFREFARVLKPGGRVAILEVATPRSRMVAAGHNLYFNRVVPLIGGLISDKEAYSYLPRSAAYLPPSEDLLALMDKCGFAEAVSAPLGLGAAQLITARRKPR